MRGRTWTSEEIEIVRSLYANMPTFDLALQLGCRIGRVSSLASKLGLRKSAEYLATPAACRLRGERGGATRFKPGQVPHNKGLRRPGWAPGRMRETQFRPGQRSGIAAENWVPIGTIRPDGEGYFRIKVREGVKGEAYGFGNTKIWPLLNRHVWEQEHGPIPAGHAVAFKDKNRANCAIENLELISRRDLMMRNTSQRWGKEVFQAIQLVGVLNRRIRNREKQNVGSAQPSL